MSECVLRTSYQPMSFPLGGRVLTLVSLGVGALGVAGTVASMGAAAPVAVGAAMFTVGMLNKPGGPWLGSRTSGGGGFGTLQNEAH